MVEVCLRRESMVSYIYRNEWQDGEHRGEWRSQRQKKERERERDKEKITKKHIDITKRLSFE